MPFAIPKKASSFLSAILNSSFLRSSMVNSNVTEATKNRQKTNANGSVYINPILMTGNEVPHRIPASMVKKTALLFLVNSGLGKPLVSSSLSS
jgi:hypothetical protein